MAVNISNVASTGLLSQQYPPPLLPKPGKENVRLQKLLKKTAKKKAASQASQTQVPFRSSLSPVNEASPDLEHSDHSTPPKTPETPIYGGTLHPRFNVRTLYQHSPSPYPHQQGLTYGKTARFSPQPYVTPGLITPQNVAPLFSYTTSPHTSYDATSVTVTSVTAITTMTEIMRPANIKPSAAQVSAAVQHINSVVLATKLEANSTLTPTLITSKATSPQPTAFDSIKPSKPMFDVPQITNYTSKTPGLRTYYTASPTIERSKTPLSEVMRGPTPTFEVKRIVTPTSELKRDKTPTREIRRGTTPTSEIKRGPTPTSEIKRGATPTLEIKRGATPFEIKRGATPTSEIKRGSTPTLEIKRGATPTSEIKRGSTPTLEIKRGATPTSEIKRGTTPTLEIKRVATPTVESRRGPIPTSEIKSDTSLVIETTRGRTPTRTRTPTFEFSTSKTSLGRPKTPSFHVSPSRTPVIEISKPNPLLFAVSPVHMEGRRSKTPTSSVLGPSDETPQETKDKPREVSEAIQTGEIKIKPYEALVDKMPSESIREHEASKPKIPTQEASTEISGSQTPNAHVHESTKAESAQTSNQEFAKAVISTPRQSPKVPPFAGQRPRTPTSKSISTYYGLTPGEYVAYGGIQIHTPAFGLSRAISPSNVEYKPLEQPQEPTQTNQGNTKEESTLKEAAKPEAVPKETETSKTSVGEILPSTNAAFDKGMPVVTPSTVSKPTTPTMETKLKPLEEVSKLPTSETKENVPGVPLVTVPTIVVSKPETPPSEVPKAVTTAPVTQRVRTPTYGPPKPKTPPPDSVIESTKPETKPAPPSAKPTTPDQNADMAKILTPTLAEAALTEQINKVPKKPPEPQKSLLQRIKEQKSLATMASEKTATEKTEDKPLVKPTNDQKDKVKPEKEDSAEAEASTLQETKSAVDEKVADSSLSTAEPLLKVIQKPKGMKSKMSGWSRLKKHMVVDVEEPKFPESESSDDLQKDAPESNTQKQSEQKIQSEEAENISEKSQTQDGKESPRAAKMWDAVLFQMFSTKESILQQIEASKTEEQRKEEAKMDKPKEIPTFAHRLPVLLYSPRFDARKLREAASRPVTKIATVFEMGLIGRKNKDEEPKDFNRTAKGFPTAKTAEV